MLIIYQVARGPEWMNANHIDIYRGDLKLVAFLSWSMLDIYRGHLKLFALLSWSMFHAERFFILIPKKSIKGSFIFNLNSRSTTPTWGVTGDPSSWGHGGSLDAALFERMHVSKCISLTPERGVTAFRRFIVELWTIQRVWFQRVSQDLTPQFGVRKWPLK